jgi:GNAT superfamily N-acetyltransferase
VLLIAEDHATPVGYAFVRMEPASIEALCEPSAWLHDVYVDPPFRGGGVGRQLVPPRSSRLGSWAHRALCLVCPQPTPKPDSSTSDLACAPP